MFTHILIMFPLTVNQTPNQCIMKQYCVELNQIFLQFFKLNISFPIDKLTSQASFSYFHPHIPRCHVRPSGTLFTPTLPTPVHLCKFAPTYQQATANQQTFTQPLMFRGRNGDKFCTYNFLMPESSFLNLSGYSLSSGSRLIGPWTAKSSSSSVSDLIGQTKAPSVPQQHEFQWPLTKSSLPHLFYSTELLGFYSSVSLNLKFFQDISLVLFY